MIARLAAMFAATMLGAAAFADGADHSGKPVAVAAAGPIAPVNRNVTPIRIPKGAVKSAVRLPPPPPAPYVCSGSRPDDCDGDGFLAAGSPGPLEQRDANGRVTQVWHSGDCNDQDATAHPGNTEIADFAGHDEDCDPTTFGKRDVDADGYFDAAACNWAGDHWICGNDCDDTRAATHPSANEVCNGYDDECDGVIDDVTQGLFYQDADGDGFGNSARPLQACYPEDHTAANKTDCNDADALVHPGQFELKNGKDDNCNGAVDELPLLPQ